MLRRWDLPTVGRPQMEQTGPVDRRSAGKSLVPEIASGCDARERDGILSRTTPSPSLNPHRRFSRDLIGELDHGFIHALNRRTALDRKSGSSNTGGRIKSA